MKDFPYKPRKNQIEMINDIKDAILHRKHFIAEAPTGFGKTVVVLSSLKQLGIEKIVYLTRTLSQQRTVIKESAKLGLKSLAIQGRSHYCPIVRGSEELMNGDAEELSKLCSELRKSEKGCEFWNNNSEVEDAFNLYPEEFYEKFVSENICPYQAMKILSSRANVVSAPYIFYLNPIIRKKFYEWLAYPNPITVVDEAHNFPEVARDSLSVEVTLNSVIRAENEAKILGDPMLSEEIHSTDFMESVAEVLEEFEGERILQPYEFESVITGRLKIKFLEYKEILERCIEIGDEYRKEKARNRKLPRSYLYRVCVKLLYIAEGLENSVRIGKGGKNPRIVLYPLDITPITVDLRNSLSVHVSGTLYPLEYYRDIVGLPQETVMKIYPSPFPEKNLLVLYTTEVTSKFEYRNEDTYKKMAEYIENIYDFGRNSAVFFPSYKFMRDVLKYVDREIYIEGSEDANLILSKFLKHGGMIAGVLGGRFSEGIDLPGKLLEIVVIAGFPYPHPNIYRKALMTHLDNVLGKGWEYVFEVPAIRKTVQAIGRLIRSEVDRGVAIILDKRAFRLANYYKNIKKCQNTQKIIKELEKFFSEAS